MRAKLIGLGALTGFALALSLFVVIPKAATSEEPAYVPRFTIDQARSFQDFELYYLGDSFEGIPLERIIRINAKPLPAEPIRRNDVSFIYGWCRAEQEACLPPLQVQAWDACQRNLGLFDYLPERRLTVRGVPAATWEGGWSMDLYTGRVAIAIFGRNPDQVARAALALRGVNNSLTPAQDLPPPIAGALEGKLPSCGAKP
jgi:hypothetical protein